MKTAIVGMGPHGKRILKVVQEQFKELNLVGIIDKREDVLSTIDIIEENKFQGLEDLYLKHKVEVLLIATNGPSHAPITLEAIDRGVKYIMVEKPMACSVSDALKMEEKAKEANVKLSVNQSRRFSPLYIWLKEKIEEGHWGGILSIYIQRPGIGLGCLGTHSFDLANFLVDKFPKHVTGWIDKPHTKNPRGDSFIDPGGLVIIDYDNEVRAIVSQIERGSGSRTIEINLTGCRIRIDEKFDGLEILERDLSIVPGPGRPAAYSFADRPQGLSAKADMSVMLEGVIKDLIYNNPMGCDAKYGRMSIEVLSAAYASSQQNHKPIDIPLNEQHYLDLFLPVT